MDGHKERDRQGKREMVERDKSKRCLKVIQTFSLLRIH